ncbi:MAG: deoxyhypusine synthase [Candidatus Altiarchaeota archaeon]|nr:deoxyhypusine synthase [Candidatus Altiarchaeota archaeon]
MKKKPAKHGKNTNTQKMKNIKDIRPSGSVKNLIRQLGTTGFQATNLSNAVDLIDEMKNGGDTVFLTFTANMMASGLRGIFTKFIESGLVDAVITTGGSIDHDIIRSYKTYTLGGFNADDVALHKRGINRIGNILVPTNRYVFLEKKMRTYFTEVYKKKKVFTPSQLCDFIGSKLPRNSFLNACHRMEVPVFSPGIVDSAVGMHLYFFRQEHRDFILDTAGDLSMLADLVFEAEKTAGIIVGGGISKHHLIGANLLRGGLDRAVYITTSHEFDGSLSGAQPKEAKSWGKIRERGETVTVHGEATIVLPLIASAVL